MQRGCWRTVAIWRKISAPSRSCATDMRNAPAVSATVATAKVTHARIRLRLRGRDMDRFADALIGPASTDVGDGSGDVAVGRTRRLGEQGGGRHDHAALAVAALRHLLGDPGLLERVRAIARQALDGRDLAPC